MPTDTGLSDDTLLDLLGTANKQLQEVFPSLPNEKKSKKAKEYQAIVACLTKLIGQDADQKRKLLTETLLDAAEYGPPAVVIFLLEKVVRAASNQDIFSCILSYAARSGQLAVVNYMLENFTLNQDALSQAIQASLRRRRIDACIHLLEKIQEKTVDQIVFYRAFGQAVTEGAPQIIDYLLQKIGIEQIAQAGRITTTTLFTTTTLLQQSIKMAAEYGNAKMAVHLMSLTEIIRLTEQEEKGLLDSTLATLQEKWTDRSAQQRNCCLVIEFLAPLLIQKVNSPSFKLTKSQKELCVQYQSKLVDFLKKHHWDNLTVLKAALDPETVIGSIINPHDGSTKICKLFVDQKQVACIRKIKQQVEALCNQPMQSLNTDSCSSSHPKTSHGIQ